MTYISLDRFATALGMTEDKHTDSHEFASVVRINEDGSYGVRFNGATEVTRAVKCCDAEVGDRVQCVISNGQVSATCRVGGSKDVSVLYDDATGTGGTVTLSSNAANFEHMRIYFKKNGDSASHGSVDIYQPNGKVVSMILMNPFDDSNVQAVGKAVTISGTSVANYRREAYANTNSGGIWVTTTSPSIYITRVEAW